MPSARPPTPAPCVGVVLAGGHGRRIGGDKAAVHVGGRTLLDRALDVVGRVARPVAVVTRDGTTLPPLPDPAPLLWVEDDDGPRHPLAGVVHALRRADGPPVLVCAVDLPLLDVATLHVILVAAALAPQAPVVVPRAGGHLQVLCALYRPAALPGLRGFDDTARVSDLVMALGPAIVPFDDESPFFNVNTPQDVGRAEAMLSRR